MALCATNQTKKKAQEKWRQRDREVRNSAQVNVRVPIGLKAPFKWFAELLRDGKKSWEAFDAAFPKGHAALFRAARPPKQEQPPEAAKDTRAAPAAGSASAGSVKPKRRGPSAGR